MSNIRFLLQGSYATRNGHIDPWGTISILDNSVAEPIPTDAIFFFLQPGLKVWSEKLVKYGKGNYRAHVTLDAVEVTADDGTVVEKIPYSSFVAVDIHESFVSDNGYLIVCLIGRDSINYYLRTLKQAARGEKPSPCDNSPFVQIDEKFAGQEFVELNLDSPRNNPRALVFTKDGEPVPCKIRYPLSFAKWEPDSPAARYSLSEQA